jgi:AraC-like DNA-binding protein
MPHTFLHPKAWPFVDGRSATDSAACYRPHTHPTLSVGIVDSGESRLSLGQETIGLGAGDVVVINAHEVHACNPLPNRRWGYRMLYFDPAWARVSEPRRWTTPLRHPQARQHFDDMMRIVSGGGGTTEEKALHRSLMRLLDLARGAPRTAHPASDALLRVRAHIVSQCHVELPLRELARQARLSPYQLLRQFKKRFGLTPHAFQLDQRVGRARELLKRGFPAAEVALELGFADQSHLMRVFKARVAATPGQFVAIRGRARHS